MWPSRPKQDAVFLFPAPQKNPPGRGRPGGPLVTGAFVGGVGETPIGGYEVVGGLGLVPLISCVSIWNGSRAT
jgi:hypothetical protein